LEQQYKIQPDNFGLTDDGIKEMVRRKADFLAGKTTSRPWNEIKKRYECI